MAFWWMLIGILNHIHASSDAFDSSWTTFFIRKLMVLGATLICLLVAIYSEYRTLAFRRASILYDLQAQEHSGLGSSLGSAKRFLNCPWTQANIVKTLKFDSTELIQWLSKNPFNGSAQVVSMIRQMQIDHPLHTIAMLNCLYLMAQKPFCPAYHGLDESSGNNKSDHPTHTQIVHGNTTLIEHAMQVCIRSVELAHSFDYQGIRGEYNKIAKREASFQLSHNDPMIPLICLAHDIGKLITFERNESGQVLRVQGLHGQVGARALAQSSFIKALPMCDQSALFKALSFYHHPLDFTLDLEAKIESDRQAALMMLLIKADHLTSTHEKRQAFKVKNNQTLKPI